MKSSNIGGQAVIEGVMMKNGDRYAVAVRKPNQEIEVMSDEYRGIAASHRLLRLPLIRGVFNFVDSLILGMKTLTYSADFYAEDEDAEPTKADIFFDKLFKGKTESVIMGAAMVLSVVLAVGIFMILPYFLSGIFKKYIASYTAVAAIEGAIRLLIFIGYVVLISKMKDIHRVFCYHGAEHKCINCIEHGMELTVENVMKSSKQHKRCGTSFMLIVMVISIFFFMFIRVDSPVLRVVLRLVLIPVIAGVSYEFIKLAGRSENALVNILSRPGMWLQNLTTKEPEPEMAAVAIASVEAVFDWKAYLNENFGTHYETEEEKEVV